MRELRPGRRHRPRGHPGGQDLLLTASTMVLTLVTILLLFLVVFQSPAN